MENTKPADALVVPSKPSTDLTPQQIVEELDKYIIGQDDAKRSVSIALRNRWRRMRVPEELREEILPKNITMIGPTGCVGWFGELSPRQVVERAMEIAASICIYTNNNLIIEEL